MLSNCCTWWALYLSSTVIKSLPGRALVSACCRPERQLHGGDVDVDGDDNSLDTFPSHCGYPSFSQVPTPLCDPVMRSTCHDLYTAYGRNYCYCV